MSIDPGINNLGLTVTEVNIKTKRVKIISCQTLQGDKMIKQRPDIEAVLGNRQGKLRVLTEYIIQVSDYHAVDTYAMETCYMAKGKKQISGFEALTQVIAAIRQSIYATYGVAVGEISPNAAKAAANSAMGSKDKTLVTDGLKTLSFIDWNGYNPDELTEHANDSIAIGIAHMLPWLE